jgi:CSLREA domain-containing protein
LLIPLGFEELSYFDGIIVPKHTCKNHHFMYNGRAAHRHSFHNCTGESSSGGGIMISGNLKRSFSLLVVGIILVTISGTASANPNSPQADPIYVDTTEDHYEVTPDGDCSLREAITTINNGSAFGGCPYPTGATNIELAEGATYILMIDGANEDNNATGDLDILAEMTIDGGNSTVTAWYLTDRVLEVNEVATVIINDLTIQDGSSVLVGGGIYSLGYLTLNDSTVQNNSTTSEGAGGGIFSAYNGSYPGALILHRTLIYHNLVNGDGDGGGVHVAGSEFLCEDSTLSNNTASFGGGLYLYSPVDAIHATITRCEIVSNEAFYGGGLLNSGRTLIQDSEFISNNGVYGGNITNTRLQTYHPIPELSIVRTGIHYGDSGYCGGGVLNVLPASLDIKYSTISWNMAEVEGGGGVCNYGPYGTGSFTIDHTTFNDNDSNGPGSAIASYTSSGIASPVLVTNSIIAGPSSPTLCNYPLDPSSYADLETTNTCNLDPSPIYRNYVNTPVNFASGLQNNGSKYLIGVERYATLTYALLPTSLAVDHADCALYTEDQRGYPLFVDGNGDGDVLCDMGSYELQIFSFIPMIKKP